MSRCNQSCSVEQLELKFWFLKGENVVPAETCNDSGLPPGELDRLLTAVCTRLKRCISHVRAGSSDGKLTVLALTNQRPFVERNVGVCMHGNAFMHQSIAVS